MPSLTGSSTTGAPAVDGTNTDNGPGVRGLSSTGAGVHGESNGASPATGVHGTSGAGRGVTGESTTAEGVFGTSNSGPGVSGSGTTGVYGVSVRNNGAGVSGYSQGGDGVYGFSQDSAAVHGVCNGQGYAGRFEGNVVVTGRVQAAGFGYLTTFLARRAGQLPHSYVGSSEELNLYTGVVSLDSSGAAVVELPSWFGELNQGFTYGLTAVGSAAPELHVAEEIRDRSFRIAGGSAGMRVSWHVTGVRQDTGEATGEQPWTIEQDASSTDTTDGAPATR